MATTKKTAAKKAAPKVTAEVVAKDTAESKAQSEAAAAAASQPRQEDPDTVTRAPSGELKGDTGQPAFASTVPTASVHKFLVDGAPGEQESHQFEGQGAEQQAKDFIAANEDPSWFWTLNTGSRAVQAIPAVDAGAAKAR